MDKKDLLNEAFEIDGEIKAEKNKAPHKRTPLFYIGAIFLVLIIVSMVFPYYGIKLDPEPGKIVSFDYVLEYLDEEIVLDNSSRKIDSKIDFNGFLNPNDPLIKGVADIVVSKSQCDGNKICYCKSLYYFVKENFQYINDPPDEFVKTAKETLRNGGGDCDDLSVLLANLIESIGVETRFVFVSGHVYIEAYLPDALNKYKSSGQWVPMDSTCEYCKFGEMSISSSSKEKSYV